jgi:hypothetical protein
MHALWQRAVYEVSDPWRSSLNAWGQQRSIFYVTYRVCSMRGICMFWMVCTVNHVRSLRKAMGRVFDRIAVLECITGSLARTAK